MIKHLIIKHVIKHVIKHLIKHLIKSSLVQSIEQSVTYSKSAKIPLCSLIKEERLTSWLLAICITIICSVVRFARHFKILLRDYFVLNIVIQYRFFKPWLCWGESPSNLRMTATPMYFLSTFFFKNTPFLQFKNTNKITIWNNFFSFQGELAYPFNELNKYLFFKYFENQYTILKNDPFFTFREQKMFADICDPLHHKTRNKCYFSLIELLVLSESTDF